MQEVMLISNLIDILTASVDASVIINNSRFANGDFFGTASTLRPNRFSPLVPIDMFEEGNESLAIMAQNSNNIIDGKYLFGGSQLDQTNVFADIYAGGSTKTITEDSRQQHHLILI